MKRFTILLFTVLELYSFDRKAIDTQTITFSNYATHGLYFIIPEDLLMNSQKDLRALLARYDITISKEAGFWGEEPISFEKLQSFYEMLLKRLKSPTLLNAIAVEKVPNLLRDAKLILKSFLPLNETEQRIIINSSLDKNKIGNCELLKEKQYIAKDYGFMRLFTYSKLERTIQEKKLTHVKLPQKFLIIQNMRTGQYLSPNQATDVIDKIFKLYALNDATAQFGYDLFHNPYDLRVFSKKQERFSERGGLNKAAMRELEILCKESPFDIGFGNIFWDSKGDAVIIDTEFKGTNKKDCEKLQRYPVTQSNL